MRVLKCTSCVTLMQALNLFESYFLHYNMEFIIPVKLYYFKVSSYSKFLWLQTFSPLIDYFFFKWAHPPPSSSKLSFPERLVLVVTRAVLSTREKWMLLFPDFLYLHTRAQYLGLMSSQLSPPWKYTRREVQCTNLFIQNLLHVCFWIGGAKTKFSEYRWNKLIKSRFV